MDPPFCGLFRSRQMVFKGNPGATLEPLRALQGKSVHQRAELKESFMVPLDGVTELTRESPRRSIPRGWGRNQIEVDLLLVAISLAIRYMAPRRVGELVGFAMVAIERFGDNVAG